MKNNNKEKDDRLNPNNKICNPPTYMVHGKDRRELKKELSGLKSFLKTFWHEHNMDKDMAAIYGSIDGYPMSDEKAKSLFESKSKQMEKLEKKLSIPYLPVYREERLRQLLDEEESLATN